MFQLKFIYFLTLDFLALDKDIEDIESPPPIFKPVDINVKDHEIWMEFYLWYFSLWILNNTALLNAFEDGFLPIVHSLLSIHGIDINAQNNNFI